MAGNPARGNAAMRIRERRAGPDDRRRATEDRRNADRLDDDETPRRNPEVTDRRAR